MSRSDSSARRITYWITTFIIAAVFAITGIGNILPFAHIARDMAHLGYPTYFLTILGAWKVLAAVAILIRGISRVREWAFAGMILDLTGAAFSRVSAGDDLPMIIIPLAIAGLVTTNYLLYHSLRANDSQGR